MSGLDGKKGAEIREALIQFGKNIKSDVSRTAPFNKNVNGRIVEVNPDGYTVEIQTRNYPNVKAINAQQLQINDIVACCIPNNQMSQVYILGKLVGNISVSSGGSGTMTDMQVNSVSVVNNGVGNIVTKGVYNASTNRIATESDIPAISQTQNNGATTVPSDNLLLKSSFARVYRSLSELTGITTSSTMLDVMRAMDNGGSYLIADISGYTNLYPVSTNYPFGVLEIIKLTVNRASAKYVALNSSPTTLGTVTRMWYGEFQNAVSGYEWSGWKEVLNAENEQTITGAKTFQGNNTLRSKETASNQRAVQALANITAGTYPSSLEGHSAFQIMDKDGSINLAWYDYLLGSDGTGQIRLGGRTCNSSGTQLTARSVALTILNDNNSVFFNPSHNGVYSLGRTTLRWKDIYMSGNLSDGTNSATVGDIIRNATTGMPVNTTYPVSSSSASNSALLSEKAIYDGVVSEINAATKYLHTLRIVPKTSGAAGVTVTLSFVSTSSSTLSIAQVVTYNVFGVCGFYWDGTNYYPIVSYEKGTNKITFRMLPSFTSIDGIDITTSNASNYVAATSSYQIVAFSNAT